MSDMISRWAKVLTATALVVGGVLLVVNRIIVAAVAETYSPDWASASAADAGTRGLLRGRPAVVPRTLLYRGDSLTVVDAWVEQATHLEYKWFVLRREIRDPRYRLVLRASRAWHPTDFHCDRWLGYADTIRLGQSGSTDFFDVRSTLSFPDTIRLRVARDANCHDVTNSSRPLPPGGARAPEFGRAAARDAPPTTLRAAANELNFKSY